MVHRYPSSVVYGDFFIGLFLGKRIFRGQVVDAEKARAAVATSATLSKRLVNLWILFFLYGVIETAQEKIPLNRAIPAGAFLLAFIGVFGWIAYRMRHQLRRDRSEKTGDSTF